MATIKRVIVSKGNNKIDFTGLVPDAATNPNIKTITVVAPEAPDLKKVELSNTTIHYTGNRGQIGGSN
jgi:hypothetical protein